jgi:hypothetical protein
MGLQSEDARIWASIAAYVAAMLFAGIALAEVAIAFGSWVTPVSLIAGPLCAAAWLEIRHRRKAKGLGARGVA